jgi:Uri superfamily endonuclease
MKGTYLLLIKLDNNEIIQVGKLGKISFKKGFYVYAGSALNGLEQRIERHLRKDKKIHWHIDFLLEHGKIIDVFYKETTSREECKIAETFANRFPSIPGFGCSDCNCNSHLFFASKEELLFTINEFKMMNFFSDHN